MRQGSVEGDIGRFRRNHLVPVPEVDSIQELNGMIDGYDITDDTRRIGSRARTVGEAFAAEQSLLKPLPMERFETGLWLTPRVDRYAQITVRSNRYSAPSRLIGRRVRVLLHASELSIFDGRTPVAAHEPRVSPFLPSVAETYAPGVAKTNNAMKATLMKNVASTRLTVMKNGV
jgi:hypothetical protein